MKKIKYKTNTIGVCFFKAMLEDMKSKNIANTPQQALNYLSGLYSKNEGIVFGSGGLIEKTINESIKVPQIEKNNKKVGLQHNIEFNEKLPNNSPKFDTSKLFRISEHTIYPEKERPSESDKFKRAEWDMFKRISDKKIKEEWENQKKSVT